MMRFWPATRQHFRYIQVCLLAAVILWLAFAHVWLLEAIAIAAGMWVILFFVYQGSTYTIELHRRANRSEIRQFYIFMGLFYLFLLWLVIALKFDRLHPR
jgi:lysylphosphatidylglycerol synthetase-like protein (DUF2156 family)